LVFFIIRPFFIQAFFIPSESMVPTLLERDHILVNKLIYRIIREPEHGDVVVFRAPPEASGGEERDFIKRVIGVPGDTIRLTPGYVLIGNQQYRHPELRSLLADYAPRGSDVRVKLYRGHVWVSGVMVSDKEIAEAAQEPNARVKVVPGKLIRNGKVVDEPYTAEDPDDVYPGGPRNLVENDWLRIDKDGNQVVKIPKGKLLVMGDNRNDSNDARYWGLLDRSRVLGKAWVIFWPISRIRIVH